MTIARTFQPDADARALGVCGGLRTGYLHEWDTSGAIAMLPTDPVEFDLLCAVPALGWPATTSSGTELETMHVLRIKASARNDKA